MDIEAKSILCYDKRAKKMNVRDMELIYEEQGSGGTDAESVEL